MKWLRTLHRYLGVVAAVILLVVAVSGGVLIFKEEIWRLRFADLAEPIVVASAADYAAAFAAIDVHYGSRVRLIRMPHPGVPAYHIYLHGGEALWHQDGSRPIHEWAWYQSPLGILTELHIHLAAGDTGKNVLGYLGFAAAFMAASGLLLWWPLRRRFQTRSLVPSNPGRPALMRLHRDLGALAAAFIVLFSLTASAVVFGQASRELFNRLFSGEVPEQAIPSVEIAGTAPMPDVRIIERALAALPAAQLRSYSPPPSGSGVHYFRFQQPDEVHPNGRSTVYIDVRDGTLLHHSDATRAPPGDRFANWMYPLHAARWGGWPYRLLALLSAVALTAMSLSGLVTFVQAQRRGRHKRR